MNEEKPETLGGVPPSLQALFDRDPLGLTRPEINSIIEELRKQRVNFAQAENQARAEGKRVNARKAIAGPSGPVSASILQDLLKDL